MSEARRPTKEFQMPSGATLYRIWQDGIGWTYISDEVDGGVNVWIPALVDTQTMHAALEDWKNLSADER